MQLIKPFLLASLLFVVSFTGAFGQSVWTMQNSGIPSSLVSVVWANNQFLAVGGTYGSNARVLTSPDGFTWTERNSGGTDRIYDVVWTGSQYVAVGLATASSGIVLTSPDGVNWTTRTTSISNGLRSVAWTGSLLVATGNAGIIRTSPDGINWTNRTSPVGNSLQSVIWTGTQLVAVGLNGNIVTSPDGISWTQRTSPTTKTLHAVAWTGTQFVAVGDTGVILTSPTAATWTPRTSSSPHSLSDVIWTGSQLIAVGGDDISSGIGAVSLVATSPDGIAWTTRLSTAGNNLISVIGNGNRFVATGSVGLIMASQDSTPPVISSSPQSQTVAGGSLAKLGVSVASGAALPLIYTWVHAHGGVVDTLKRDTLSALQDTLTLATASSPDTGSYRVVVRNVGGSVVSASAVLGVNAPAFSAWNIHNSGVPTELGSVVWGNNQFLAVGGWYTLESTVLTSPDGVTWTARNAGTANQIYDVAWAGTQYVAVGPTSSAGFILTSPDGISWTQRATTTNGMRSVVWTGSQIVATGNGGAIYTSPNGITWVKQASPVTTALYSVAWTGRQLVSVGTSGVVVTSPDGVNWTQQASPTSQKLYNLAWTGTQLVAVGDTGVILTSPDAVTWTSRASGTGLGLQGITWTGNQLVAVGGDGQGTSSGTVHILLTSPDGISWTTRLSGPGRPLKFTASSGSKLVAVGTDGTLLNSASSASSPVIASGPLGRTVLAGTQVKLGVAVNAGASASLTYTWRRLRGGVLDTLSQDTTLLLSDTLTLASSSLEDTGSYSVVVSNGAGGATSATAVLNVNAPPVIASQPRDTTVAVGTGATFTVTVAAGPGSMGGTLSYQWKKNGVNLSPNGTSATYAIASASVTDTGVYTVVVTRTLNSTTTSTTSSAVRLMLPPFVPAIWTAQSSGRFNELDAVVWGNNQFVAVGGWYGLYSTVLTSPDGLTWTERITSAPDQLYNVMWTGTQYMAVGLASANTGLVMTSPDGIAWTTRTSSVSSGLRGITWTGSQYVATGNAGIIRTSTDGNGWTTRTSPVGTLLSSVVWTGSQVVAVGNAGNIVTSPTGSTWTKRTSPTTRRLTGVAWTGTQLVAVGDTGTVLTSPDGVTWTPRTPGTGLNLSSVVWTGNQLLATGGNDVAGHGTQSVILTSPDGITWTSRLSGGTPLKSAAWNGAKFVSVGTEGAILATAPTDASPSVSAGPLAQTVVVGSQVAFGARVAAGASVPLVYNWLRNRGGIVDTVKRDTLSILADTLVLENVQLSDTGSYSVLVKNIAGSSASAAAILSVNAAPTFASQPRDTTVAAGANASFTVVPASGPGSMGGVLSYQWKKNGVNVSVGGTSETLSLSSVSMNDTSLYSVVVTRTLNATATSATSTAGKLFVNAAPVFATQPRDTTVASGSAAHFTVAVAAAPGSMGGTVSYQWKKGGVDVAPGGTSATLSLASASIEDMGSYTVVATRTLNGATASTTSAAGVLLVNLPPAIGTQPRDTSVVSGAGASFTVAATGSGALSYQWKRNGTNVAPGGTSATLTLAAAGIADTGSYTVDVTNTLNGTTKTTTSIAGLLSVNTAPVLEFQPRDTTVVAGANGAFLAVVASGPGSMGGVLSYQWKKGGVNVATGGTSAILPVTAASLSDMGSYTVLVTRTLNGTTTTTLSNVAVLTVNVAPGISVQPRDTAVVSGGGAGFTVTASAGGVLSYQWRKDGVNIVTGGASATLSLASATIADTGAYTVVVTNTVNGTMTTTLSNAAALRVNVAPVIATQPRDTTVVSGTSANFSVAAASGPGSLGGVLSYQWKKNGVDVTPGGTSSTLTLATATVADRGSFSVVVTRTLNGTITSTTSNGGVLVVNASPTIGTQPRDTAAVAGSPAGFTVSASGSGALSYQWKKNGVNVASGGTSATLPLSATGLADTGSYTVLVTNTVNGTTTSTLSNAGILRVNAAPVLSSQPRDTTVAGGTAASFAVTALVDNGGSAGTFSYQWRRNGANLTTGGTAAALTVAAAGIADTGSYTVVVTRALNGTTTSTTSAAGRLNVNAAPVISSQPRDTTVIAEVAASFSVTASAPGGGILSYQWKKNGVNVASGGTTAAYSTAATTLADTGSYTVTVTSALNGTTSSTTSNVAFLRVNVAPVIATQPVALQTLTVGGGATMMVAVAPGGGSSAGVITYQWRKNGTNLENGGNVAGATSPTLTLTGLALADSGSYTVLITRTLNGTLALNASSASVLSAPVAIRPDAFVIRVNGQERPYAFQLPAGTTTERLTLSILDAWGRTVWQNTVRPSRDKLTEVAWNGRSANGRLASAGMYIVRISVLNSGVTTHSVRKSVTLKPR
jgi:hypothetical protein